PAPALQPAATRRAGSILLADLSCFCGARDVHVVVSPDVCCRSRCCLTAVAGGAAESQRAFQDHGRRPAGGEASGGDLLGGGAEESEGGVSEPGGGERAVEVAGVLASLDDLFEPGGAGVVGVVAAGRVPGGGGPRRGWRRCGAGRRTGGDSPAGRYQACQRSGQRYLSGNKCDKP